MKKWFKKFKKKSPLPETHLEAQHPLKNRRDFVYLDEASVVSLLASVRKGMAVEWSEEETRSLAATLGGEVAAGIPGAGAKASSSISGSEGSARSVLTKSVVQSRFGQLLVESNNEWVLGRSQSDKLEFNGTLDEKLEAAKNAGLACPSSSLERGRLLEMVLRVEVADIYTSFLAVDSMREAISLESSLLSVDGEQRAALEGGRAFLSWLVAGNVPIECESISHVLVNINDKEWIVDRNMIDDLGLADFELREIVLAGVTETRLYWTDLRRILYGGNTFHAFCRIKRPGIQKGWEPIKQMEVLAAANPALGEALRDIVRKIPALLHKARPDDASTVPYPSIFVCNYVKALGLPSQQELALETLETWQGENPSMYPDLALSVDTRRSLCKSINEALAKLGTTTDSEQAANARLTAHLSALGDEAAKAALNDEDMVTTDESTLTLECEFIGLYW